MSGEPKSFLPPGEIAAMTNSERVDAMNERTVWNADDLTETELSELKAFSKQPLPTKTA